MRRRYWIAAVLVGVGLLAFVAISSIRSGPPESLWTDGVHVSEEAGGEPIDEWRRFTVVTFDGSSRPPDGSRRRVIDEDELREEFVMLGERYVSFGDRVARFWESLRPSRSGAWVAFVALDIHLYRPIAADPIVRDASGAGWVRCERVREVK